MSGLATLWSDLKETFLPAVAFADEEGAEDENAEAESPEDGDAEGEDADEDDEDDEDDDDEESADPLDELREKFTAGICHPFKHHFDECVERVTAAQEEPDYEDREYKEDCVEEFFHWEHCLNDNIAPVLFSKLK